jgi:hypothetical protein
MFAKRLLGTQSAGFEGVTVPSRGLASQAMTLGSNTWIVMTHYYVKE